MTSATKTKEGRQKVRPGNIFPETVQCFGSEENVLGEKKMFCGGKRKCFGGRASLPSERSWM